MDVADTAVHPDTTPNLTVSESDLQSIYHLSATDAGLVADAEGFGPGGASGDAPVEVSVGGKVIVDTNQDKGSTGEAIATSTAKTTDISIAIGGGTNSHASGNGAVALTDGTNLTDNHDKASAVGTDAMATNQDSISTAASASGLEAHAIATSDSDGSEVKAAGTDAAAQVTSSAKGIATASLYGAATVSDSTASTAKASEDAAAVISYSDESTASASGPDASAAVSYSTGSTASASHTVKSTEVTLASVGDGFDSHATATGVGSSAVIDGAGFEDDGIGADTVADSTAKATNGGSAAVENDGAPVNITVTDDKASASGAGSGAAIVDSEDASLTVTDGEREELVDVSGKHETNPQVVGVTDLADAHSTPLTPIP